MTERCSWAGSDPLYIEYHDNEWGYPKFDDATLFEFLLLESFQAGLSWITILRKRENFRKTFSNFDYHKIARYSQKKIERLLNDPGIIRNKLKIESAIKNARGFIKIQKEFGSFSEYIWGFVGGRPIVNKWKSFKEIPVADDIAKEMSKDLKKRGFNFVGPTICYSFMQAAGLVNDHLISCPFHKKPQTAIGLPNAFEKNNLRDHK